MDRVALKSAAKSQIKGNIGILFVITLLTGLNINAGECRGHAQLNSVSRAGAQRIDQVAVIEGNDQITALVLPGKFFVGRACGRGCGDLEVVTLHSQLHVRAHAARNALLGERIRPEIAVVRVAVFYYKPNSVYKHGGFSASRTRKH